MENVLVLVWLAACAWRDVQSREIPDWLFWPALISVLIVSDFSPLSLGLVMGTIAMTLAGLLPGGDMRGLIVLALFDPALYAWAWGGAGATWLIWRLVRRERAFPGFAGFFVGAAGWFMAHNYCCAS